MLLPTLAFAAGDEHPLDWAGLGWRILVFVVFIGILYYFLRKPVLDALVTRTEEIEHALNSAERAKADAEAKVREYQEKTKLLEQELEEMKNNVLKSAEKERDFIISDAKQKVEKLKQNALNMIASETEQAKHAIKRELVVEIFAEAEKQIANDMKGADAKAVLDSYIKRIGE